MALIDTKNDQVHPGAYVRQHVIPKGTTVTKAAAILGVGRPALSNFLNGKAALSPEMALRLERAFGADRKTLLDLQIRFSRSEEAMHGQPVPAGAYAPALISIRTRDIQRWAQDNIHARQELAALLRRLIHSTGRNLTRVDFPAYDNAERRGWDGVIKTSAPTPWIPDGTSGWEVSCREDAWRKAESDYAARLKSVPPTERNATTFVFVTARSWKKKQDWANEKAALDQWKEVRAYDASDLEQWLEQSAPAQIWFAERLGQPVEDYRSIEKCWLTWAEACDPPLSPALFAPSVERFAEKFEDWLNEEPDRPFIVAADSREEALVFLRCLARSSKTGIPGLDDRMIVFDTSAALRRFDAGTRVPLVAVIHDPEVEKEIGGFHRCCHCVITRPRNSVTTEPDIALDLLGHLDFRKALDDMGLSYDDIQRLARESARSPTILRRCLATIPAVRTPSWAGDARIARKLLPAAMVGAWHNTSPADLGVIGHFAVSDDDTIDYNVTEMLNLEDPPLWSAGEYRGVASRIDALFGIALFITRKDLDIFFEVAEKVLSEKAPAIDLPPGQRWQASLPGKVRNHSDVLRRGIRETLVILAVHGNRLFHQRLGFNVEARVAALVNKLLSPLDREKILFYGEDLPDYAEAAPEEVLSLLEKDLRKPEPVIRELMRPAGNSFFSPPLRPPLLWALEGLAWKPQRFPRVVELLAKLCATHKNEAHDNWAPRPEDTLGSLFRSWLPQTAASLDERVKALEGLWRRHPMLGWSVCIDQLAWRRSVAMPNHRPHWRDDAANTIAEVPQAEWFIRKARDLVLTWPGHDEKTLGALVERLEQFREAEQLKIWNLIGQWADSTASDEAKAILRQRIHGCAHERHRLGDSIAHPEQERAASKKLLPKDKATRQLFASPWVELPPDGSEDEAFDYETNEQRLHELRMEALREIWEARGFEGVSILLEKSEKMSSLIGGLMTGILRGEAAKFIKSCLHAAAADKESAYRSCLTGFLWKADPDLVTAIIADTERSGTPATLTTLLLCMPFRATTWRRLDNKPSDFRDMYWKRVEPRTWRGGEEEINESVGMLLAVDRAPAAFRAALVAWDQVETPLLIRLLHALSVADSEDFLNDPTTDDYNISVAFDALDKRPGVTVEEKAQLEYVYLTRLDRSEHGIPNLEKHIVASPRFYALAIACVSRRADGGEDPPELRFGDPERLSAIVSAARRLLYRVRRIPGTDGKGNIDAKELKAWLREVRSWCARHDRAEIGDHKIGRFLAHAPDDDGVWPCRPVCEALEWMASEEVARGFEIGARNRRGAYLRGEGGDQERDLAARYRAWARELVYGYPYVGAVLERIATLCDHEAGWQDTELEVRLGGW